jgi:hypothetical protein
MLEFIGRAAEDLKLTGNVTSRELASRARVAIHAINALRRQLKKLSPLSRAEREASGVAAGADDNHGTERRLCSRRRRRSR